MKLFSLKKPSRGQSALEYLILTAVVALVVVLGFKNFINPTRDKSEGYFNEVTRAIMGEDPQPIHGEWCPAYCPAPENCGPGTITRLCACPAPAFGGLYCQPDGRGGAVIQCPPAPSCKNTCKDDMVDGKPRCNALGVECGKATTGYTSCGRPCVLPAQPCDGCAGAKPQGQECPGSSDGASGTWHAVSTCTGGKCEVSCKTASTGLEPDPTKSACVPLYCKGQISAKALLCNSDKSPKFSSSSYHYVSKCANDTPECGYTCSEGTYRTAQGTCLPNTCADFPEDLKNIVACLNASVGVPIHQKPWTYTKDCSDTRTCAYHCADFFHYDGEGCMPNGCAATIPTGKGTVCSQVGMDIAINGQDWAMGPCDGPCQIKPCPKGEAPVPNTYTCKAIETCSDNIQNQKETGVDCGGPCPACPLCIYQLPDFRYDRGEVIYCRGSDTRFKCIDSGYGDHHGVREVSPNGCQAYENEENNGGGGVKIQCKRATSCVENDLDENGNIIPEYIWD